MILTKASVFLRIVGNPSSLVSFVVPEEGFVSFDAANFSKLEQGDPYVVFDVVADDYYGSGYLSVGYKRLEYLWPTITYPITAEKTGKYNLFIRVKTSGEFFNFSLLINGVNLLDKIVTTPQNQWTWISLPLVIADKKKFDLSIIPKTEGCLIDSFHISVNDTLPDVIEYQNSFLTVHFRMYEIDSDYQPNISLPIYGYKTSIEDILDDNWYNFSLETLPAYISKTFNLHYAATLFVSGSSESLYIMWDYAQDNGFTLDPYLQTCSLVLDSDTKTWSIDCEKKFALRLYSSRDAIDENACKAIVPASALTTKTVKTFSTNTSPVFVNTKAVPTIENEEKVQLSLPDRIVSIVMDQSGSQTWNDSSGVRHELARRMVDKLNATYPGDLKYNLVNFQSTPIKINFFAVTENDNLNTSDAGAAASEFFEDQESGYAGVRIVRKQGSYPTGPLDGDIVTEGFLERAFSDGLEEGQEYYYAAYTFNSSGVFSEGTFIKATPRERILPHGVGNFTSRVIIGTGVRRDENTIGLWHFNEGIDQTIYDFSDTSFTLTSSDDFIWLNFSDVPSGTSGVRFNGTATRFVGTDSNGDFVKSHYTMMAWIYPFDFNSKRTIVSRESSSTSAVGFRFGINTNKTLFFTLDDSTIASSSALLTANQWNHVAVTVDVSGNVASFYINGYFAGSGTLAQGANHSVAAMNLYIGGRQSSFFGKMTELSIHDSLRSAAYIAEAAVQPETSTDKLLDNGDRLVLLTYVVSDDFNYPGGTVRILRKESVGPAVFDYATSSSGSSPQLVFKGFGAGPSHENDGDVVYETSASSGSFTIALPYDYVLDRTYNYRIYSSNVLGNFSSNSDSPTIPIKIPNFKTKAARNAAISMPLIAPVENATLTIGNHKNYITWDAVTDENAEQVLVYWSDSGFPIISNDQGVDAGAILVFSGKPSDTYVVDRNIDNQIVSYYAIVVADKYGFYSQPVFVSGVPVSNAFEGNIPLLTISNLGYQIVNENALSLSWDAPVKFQKDIEAWFDQRVALYAQITDEFGAPIADNSQISFTATASVGSAQLAEDVFGETISGQALVPDAKSCFILSSSSIGNGFIRGVFRMTSDLDILSAINQLSADVRVSYSIPDRDNPGSNVFEFTSLPVHIEMDNPFSMEMLNIGDNNGFFGEGTSSGRGSKRRRRGSGAAPHVGSAATSAGGDTVKVLCKRTVPLDDQSFISSGGLEFDPDKFKEFPGCWIRRTRPFVSRVVILYRGEAISNAPDCDVAVFEASDPQCDRDDSSSNPCSQSGGGASSSPPEFVPGFSSRRSRSVQPPATSLPFRTGLQLLNDGTTKLVSYVDIPLKAPRTPQAIMLFAKTGYNGFFARKKMYVVFDNILRIETTIEPPESNCIDVAEQQAKVYLIDPDSTDVENPRKLAVPDSQIVRWELRKGTSGKDRPFYSTDNVPTGPGVFSYTRSGSARKVFFGPACGVTWLTYVPCPGNIILLPELYAIKASVIYDGLHAFEERPAIVYPPGDVRGFGSRFLMQMPNFVNDIYADGYDLAHVTIYHDPNIASGQIADCFKQCARDFNRPIFSLGNGQIVDIESGGDFEILYGDSLQVTFDEALDEYVITNASQEIGFAQIPLAQSGNRTDFYIRINKFLGRPQPVKPNDNQDQDPLSSTNQCSCIEVPPGLSSKTDLKIITGKTSIMFNGQTRFLSGGGDLKNGVPPTTIALREPLDISIVDIRRNGESVEKILCDSLSVHEFIVEVKFKDKAVPNGTPVFLTVGGINPEKIVLFSDTIFTQKLNDPILNPEGNKRSFASFFVYPFSAQAAFSGQVQAETNYDKRGDVVRSMTACITIKYDPSEKKPEATVTPEGEISSVFSGSLDVYDTYTDTWSQKALMKYPRGCLTLDWSFDAYGEQLYAIGGLNGKSILSYNEMYDIANDIWHTKKQMRVARFYHMSVQDSGYIYVFGGIVADGSVLAISRSVERYDIVNDVWEDVASLPIFGENPYGVAMGACVKLDNKVYIIGGIRKIGPQGSIEAMNDRVLVFDLDTQTWSWSSVYEDLDLALFTRISPTAFADKNGGFIHVLGGAVAGERDADTGAQSLEFLTDTFNINISTFAVVQDDYLYDNLPKPRYRNGHAQIGDIHYFLGGTNGKSQVLNLFESVEETSPVFTEQRLENMPKAKTAFGSTSDSWRYVYVGGGLTSGRPEGFLQILAEANPGSIRLDGQQSATVNIELKNDVGEHPNKSIRVLVQGIVLFKNATANQDGSGGTNSQQQSANSAARDALIYPVVFSSNDFVINNGVGATIMLPRSEDILKKVDEIKRKLGIVDPVTGDNGQAEDNTLVINEGEIRNPYTIKVRITILDGFYYGQTVIDIKDNQDSSVSTTPVELPPPTETTTTVSTPSGPQTTTTTTFSGCKEASGSQFAPIANQGSQTPTTDGSNVVIDQGLQQSDNPIFDLNPSQAPQLDSPTVSYFSDIEWIPQVIISVDNGDYGSIIKNLNRMRNEIPFGASQLYDALSKTASLMLGEELDSFAKSIYVNTDNEENLSFVTVDTAIEDIQAVDGFAETPVLINNLSVVFPLTLSAQLARTDTENLDRISNETGGQSQTVIDASYIDEVLNNAIGRVTGSIGWGIYECIIDLGKNSIINTIAIECELYPNTEGNWKISTSEDGFNYSVYSDPFNVNKDIQLTNVVGRYLKFSITLLSGLSASIESEYDLTPTPGVPAITGILIDYNIPTESFIYMNSDVLDRSPQQVAIAVSANRPLLSEIDVGVTTSKSTNWSDYYSGSQPSVDRFGKIFVPIRYTQTQDHTLDESLENIDGFMWKTIYGRWDVTSQVTIKDEDNNIVDPDIYRLYPQEGMVIFNSKQTGSFSISVENAGRIKVGLRVLNSDSEQAVQINGLGYMYNTNVFLPPPLSQRPPTVTDFNITPSELTIYQKIGLTYRYFDINQLDEQLDKSEIKWFINGVEVEYLRNVRTWNDITNTEDPIWIYAFTFSSSDVPSGTTVEQYARSRGESILKVGDSVYATIRANDGTLFSEVVRSQALSVIEAPPFISNVIVKGKRNDGSLQDTVTTATRAFASFAFFQDGTGTTKSQIIWFVNGIEFKRGNLNEIVGGISNNEIIVGEIKNNILGITLGNTIEVQILPVSGSIIGNPVTSSPISVENDPPSVRNVAVSPSPTASSSSALQLTYVYVDVESQQQGSTQNDQSSVKWYRAARGSSEFVEVSSLQNQKIVPAVNTSSGEMWKAEVIPFDGISVGTTVVSNIITII